MSNRPLEDGWRYYGCARWGCDAVNPDYQSYGTKDGRSWCLHHRPGPIRRLLVATTLPAPANPRVPEGMLPISVVRRWFRTAPAEEHGVRVTVDGAAVDGAVAREVRRVARPVPDRAGWHA